MGKIIDLSEFRRSTLVHSGRALMGSDATSVQLDQPDNLSLMAMLCYAEAEAKRLGILDAATFIACAQEVLRDGMSEKMGTGQGKIKN